MANFETTSRGGAKGALERATRGQLVLLLVQFAVGMAVNILGLPAGTKGAVRIETTIVLAGHLLVAAGLVVGAVATLVLSRGRGHTAMAARSLGAILVAFCAGVLDLLTGSDWWSYLMAVAATAAIALYGALLVRLERRRGTEAPPA